MLLKCKLVSNLNDNRIAGKLINVWKSNSIVRVIGNMNKLIIVTLPDLVIYLNKANQFKMLSIWIKQTYSDINVRGLQKFRWNLLNLDL